MSADEFVALYWITENNAHSMAAFTVGHIACVCIDR